MTHEFTAALWEWEAQGGWFFVSLPEEASERIRSIPRPPKPGFGSLRVSATIGATTWKTSIFPDSKSGCYVLPVKKAVRSAEGVEVHDDVNVTVEVLD